MTFMEGFKNNRTKLLSLGDDVILTITQKNDSSFSVYSSELTFHMRSGTILVVKFITNDRLQFHEGMFPAYLGSKRVELSTVTFLEFVEILKNFGAECGYNTSIKF